MSGDSAGLQPRKALSALGRYTPGKKLPGTVKLSSNENPLGSSPRALEALQEALGGLSRYPDGSATALRTALAERFSVALDEVLVGNGSDELMMLAAGAYIEPGCNAVVGAHTFSQYEFVTRVFGGEVRVAEMPDGCFNLETMRQRIDAHTRLLFLCNPNNPTGRYIGEHDLARFLERIPPHVLVVLDEAYAEYAEARDFPHGVELLKRFANLLVLRTYSKIYGLAGLRVGYGFSSPAVIDALARVKQPFTVGNLAQAGAIAALEDEEFIARSLETNRAGKAELYDALQRLGIAFYPSEANFVCVLLQAAAEIAAEVMQQHGVTVRTLDSFGMPHALRITIGTAEQNAMVITGLEALQRRTE